MPETTSHTEALSRRKNPPKRRKKHERRQDMLLVSSTSQNDIYLWAISMALMVGVLTAFIVAALIVGGDAPCC